MSTTWFITGASRGLGLQLARAVHGAGHHVVATARRRADLLETLGPDEESRITLALDVTRPDQARAGIDAAVAHFGGIDVLVNNAGYACMGFAEEMDDAELRAQFETNFFGAAHLIRATVPIMRAAGSGRIFNVSSLGGLLGAEMGSAYCASKFALEGYSECLAKELAPFGVFVTLVEPGPFRTGFLSGSTTRFAKSRLTPYDARRAEIVASMDSRNGRQPGDPARLAAAMLRLAADPHPPMRFLAGTLATDAAEAKLTSMLAEFQAWRSLSIGADGNDPAASVGRLRDQLR